MKQKEIDRKIKEFAKYYEASLREAGVTDIAPGLDSYKTRLAEMYRSEAYTGHNIYPSMDVSFIYAVIAMSLELKDAGYKDKDIIMLIEKGMASRWKTFIKILHFIDLFPFTFAIVRKWNISDHKSRVKDGSISYDYFKVEKECISYSISKCMYAQIFEYYGVRPMCKIFCNTDVLAYSGLTKHVAFARKEDLTDGNSCTDEIKKIKHRGL